MERLQGAADGYDPYLRSLGSFKERAASIYHFVANCMRFARALGIFDAVRLLKFRVVMHATYVQTQEVGDVDGHVLGLTRYSGLASFSDGSVGTAESNSYNGRKMTQERSGTMASFTSSSTGRGVGGVVVQRQVDGTLVDVPDDVTFAFAFHAFRRDSPIHGASLAGTPN